jgi:hypothetical protein
VVGPALDHEKSKDEIGEQAGEPGGGDADIGVSEEGRGGDALRRTDQHQALESEIDDACAFADQFARRGVEERGPRNNRTRQNRCGEGHGHRAPPVRLRCPSTMNRTNAIRRLMTA